MVVTGEVGRSRYLALTARLARTYVALVEVIRSCTPWWLLGPLTMVSYASTLGLLGRSYFLIKNFRCRC